MRIFQMLSSLTYGDAIGNVVLALKEAIQKLGYETEVYADAFFLLASSCSLTSASLKSFCSCSCTAA